MQFLAKFKQILYMGLRATLNFRKIKGLWNSPSRPLTDFYKSIEIAYLGNSAQKVLEVVLTKVSCTYYIRNPTIQS